MQTKSFHRLFLLATLCCGLVCSVPAALAQNLSQNASDAAPMRLKRAGLSAHLPSGPQPFNLGVEEKHVALPESDGGLSARQAFPDVGVGLTNRQAFPDINVGLNNRSTIPAVDVGLQNRQGDVPLISVPVRLLANYDLELIVDESSSMRMPDCPGFTSRWNWCGAQAHDLANQLAPYSANGLTITNFARDYVVHPHANAGFLADLFENPEFHSGTRLAEPLADRLNNYFNNRRPGSKPLLIAVITDGVPSPQFEMQMVADTLISASKRVTDPHEVTVVFFQIGGGDHKGRYFLQDLDSNLVNYGARCDIVKVVSFEHLQDVGLAHALVESIQEFARESHASTGSPITGRKKGSR